MIRHVFDFIFKIAIKVPGYVSNEIILAFNLLVLSYQVLSLISSIFLNPIGHNVPSATEIIQ